MTQLLGQAGHDVADDGRIACSHVAGHGVALGAFVGPRGEPRLGADEDHLTLAIEAAWWALARAGGPPLARICLAVDAGRPDDTAVFTAATLLPEDVPVLRFERELDALDAAADRMPALVVGARDGQAGAVVVAQQGYAAIGPVQRWTAGPALRDRRADPRFARRHGAAGALGGLGATALSPCALFEVAASIDSGNDDTVVAAGDDADVAAVRVATSAAPPAGPTADDWRARAVEGTAAEPRGGRPPGATGLDPDSALLWRERRELLGPLAARCAACGAANAPIAGAVLCRRCGGRRLRVETLPRRGRVVTWTLSRIVPRAMPGPLTVVYAELEDGTMWKALGSGLQPDDLATGSEVELVTRRLGNEGGLPVYGLAFRRPIA